MTGPNQTPSPTPRQRLGIAVARARDRVGVKQDDLRQIAGVARKTLSRIETGHPMVDIRSIRKVDEALATAAPKHWHVGRAEEILTEPGGQTAPGAPQPTPKQSDAGAQSGVVALAALLLATMDSGGFRAYQEARSELHRELGNEVLAEVDKEFKRLATARRDVKTLRHTS